MKDKKNKTKYNYCGTCYAWFGKKGGKYPTCRECWATYLNKKYDEQR